MQPDSIQKNRGPSTKACLRCHRRKQRCVGYPACSNCEAAKIPCSRTSTPFMRRLAGLSKEELLKRIEALEAEASIQPGSVSEGLDPHLPVQDEHLGEWETIDQDRQELGHVEPSPQPSPSRNMVTPSHTSPANAAQAQSQAPERFGTEPHNSCLILAIDDAVQDQILVTYLESMHRRVPFCDFFDILRTRNHFRQAASCLSLPSMKLIRLHLAYAIGAEIMKLTCASPELRPDLYFMEGLRIWDSMKSPTLVERTEILLWVVLYKLRACFSSEIWYSIGSAMRTAVDADLHREQHYQDLDPDTADHQRRLFWAVYIMERNICWSMKRPLSLADHDIDVILPKSVAHPVQSLGVPGEEQQFIRSSRPLDVGTFVFTIKLGQIKSKIYSQLYKSGQSSITRDRIPPLLDKLYQFEASLPKCSEQDYEFLQLHVKNAMRVLIEPVLSTLHASDYLIKICLEAAGGVCRLFKELRLKRCLGYSFTMINSVFVAGMTICYIVTKVPSYWTPATGNDLRVCSSALYAAAERNSSVRKYCETLDTIIEAASDYVERVSSSSNLFRQADGDGPAAADQANPRDAFDKLGHSLRHLNFEFPLHSYPEYHFDESSLQHARDSGFGLDSSSLGTIQWDCQGLLDDFDFASTSSSHAGL